jgi:23S rRNA pseudouridine2605 synthase
MPRRNTSGPSRGRRGASAQGRSAGKPRKSTPPTRSEERPTDRKKKFQRDSSATPFKKFDKRKELPAERPYEKKSSDPEQKKKFSKSGDHRLSGKPERTVKKKEFKKSGDFASASSRFVKGKPKRYSPKKEEAPTIANQTGKIRLNRYIANSGVCSRREADELIKMGLVSVNGKVITEMGFQVNPGDEVRYENRVMRAEKPVYILMNKPKGYITTTKDPQERNTVMHIIGSAVKERVYPVGRLDRNTTGLLLFTNDGELADKLSHPSYNVKKIYKVELNRALTKADFQKILEGVRLEEGRAMVDDLAIVSDDGKTVGIELHIGWNRVVRRIFEKLEYEVVKLDRSVYAGLDKKDLPRGHWRFLTKEEVVRLKHYK